MTKKGIDNMVNNENVIDFPKLKIAKDDIQVEYRVEAIVMDQLNALKKNINAEVDMLDDRLNYNQERISNLQTKINKYTNNADSLDYVIAAGSGVLSGLIDAFWVGEFNKERGRKWGEEKVNKFVIKVAQLMGYEGDELTGSIRYLENRYGAPSDSNTTDYGGSLQHHLRDFAHHPNLTGLMFSLLTQFTEKAYGTDVDGNFKVVDVNSTELIGKDFTQKILFGTVFWFLHMVSDMAGSSTSPGAGTGLPGPILSLAKQLSILPFFKNLKVGDDDLSVFISKLFNGTLLAKRDENCKIVEPFRFDLRTEIGVGYEIGRQAIPVVINECIVRSFYFIRRLFQEIKERNLKTFIDLKRVELKNILPFNNRTIVRMLTISTGTFTAIDLGDAAIRGLFKSKGNKGLFLKEFLLHVNFVGVGRFTIAVGTDVFMGVKLHNHRNERIKVLSEQLHLMNSRIFYLQANTWIAADTTGKTIAEALHKMEKTIQIFRETWEANRLSLENIEKYIPEIEQKNMGLIDDINEVLKWG